MSKIVVFSLAVWLYELHFDFLKKLLNIVPHMDFDDDCLVVNINC